MIVQRGLLHLFGSSPATVAYSVVYLTIAVVYAGITVTGQTVSLPPVC
jgi:hypothetical protein